MNILGIIMQAQQSQGQQAAPSYYFPVMMGLCFAILYFIVLRPGQKQRKQQAQMLRELQNGNVVVTTSGIIGTIVTITDDTLILRVKPDNVKLQVARNSVTGLVSEEKKT